jgi:cytidylate kinase
MKPSKPLVITISRQLGSGGAYVGQQLAKKLDIYYADHEIINKAATQLAVLKENVESRDEKLQSIWKSFLQFSALSSEVHRPPELMEPTARDLFNTESEIIKHILKEHSAVIIGRCGFHILREYPNRVSLFLHGDIDFRSDRIQKLYNVSEKVAGEMIAKSDKERALYINTFTNKKWTDSTNYDLSINTGKIGVDKSVELILNYLELIDIKLKHSISTGNKS